MAATGKLYAVMAGSFLLTARSRLKRLPTVLALALLAAYRWFLSPYLGQSCRFEPTCSHYATEAINRFGVIKGTWLTIRRLGRCHPWCEGGYDPVPDDSSKRGCGDCKSRF